MVHWTNMRNSRLDDQSPVERARGRWGAARGLRGPASPPVLQGPPSRAGHRGQRGAPADPQSQWFAYRTRRRRTRIAAVRVTQRERAQTRPQQRPWCEPSPLRGRRVGEMTGDNVTLSPLKDVGNAVDPSGARGGGAEGGEQPDERPRDVARGGRWGFLGGPRGLLLIYSRELWEKDSLYATFAASSSRFPRSGCPPVESQEIVIRGNLAAPPWYRGGHTGPSSYCRLQEAPVYPREPLQREECRSEERWQGERPRRCALLPVTGTPSISRPENAVRTPISRPYGRLIGKQRGICPGALGPLLIPPPAPPPPPQGLMPPSRPPAWRLCARVWHVWSSTARRLGCPYRCRAW